MTPDKHRRQKYNRKYRYDMTEDEFDYNILKQGFKCPICGSELTYGNSSVDHEHEENFNRGILCTSCNTGIGKLKDDPEVVKKATDYLTYWKY